MEGRDIMVVFLDLTFPCKFLVVGFLLVRCGESQAQIMSMHEARFTGMKPALSADRMNEDAQTE